MTDRSLFIEFMGDSPTIRLLDYLLTERNLDFSKTDMAKNAKVGRATLYRLWDGLIAHKLIIHTRNIGKARLYRLNEKNPAVKKIIELDDLLILNDLKKKAKLEPITV